MESSLEVQLRRGEFGVMRGEKNYELIWSFLFFFLF
jgi:hypothetical protein